MWIPIRHPQLQLPEWLCIISDPLLFSELGLSAAVLEAVTAQSYESPTAIQAEAIPALMAGRDVIGVAQTGTGKTAAFGLPLISRIDVASGRVQALVLAPTRELALQDEAAIAGFAVTTPELSTLAVYGGAPFLPQKRALAKGTQVVVGTPGRIIDHLDRGTLRLDAVKFLVLDEGDEMLRMGFAEDVDHILSAIPDGCQIALFSATMPQDIRRAAGRHLHDPVEISVDRQSSTVSTIEQCYAIVPHKRKTIAASRILASYDAEAALVFVRTRAAAEEVSVALNQRGITASVISGDVSQVEREKTVDRLRAGSIRVLVATDVAARGLDVDRIGLVVNYDLPDDAETYVHRIGRTGRAGRAGMAFSFVKPTESGKLKRIEKGIRKSLTLAPIPRTGEVVSQRASALLELVPQRIALGRLTAARQAVSNYITAAGLEASPGEQLAKLTDLAAALAAFAVGDGLTGNSEDESFDAELDRAERRDAKRRQGVTDSHLEPKPSRSGDSRKASRGGGSHSEFAEFDDVSRYWIGVGRADGLRPQAVVDTFAKASSKRLTLGRIEIHGRYCVVETKRPLEREELRTLGRTQIYGCELRIRPYLEKPPSPHAATSSPKTHTSKTYAGKKAHPGKKSHHEHTGKKPRHEKLRKERHKKRRPR